VNSVRIVIVYRVGSFVINSEVSRTTACDAVIVSVVDEILSGIRAAYVVY